MLLVLALVVVVAGALLLARPPNLEGKRILMIVAPANFRDEELLVPKEYFERLGAEVLIASKEKNTCVGMLGTKVVPDLALSEVNVDAFDAIVFVGGPGSLTYYNDPEALRIAREAAEKGKVLAAICLAPGILARAGVLKGKRATVWHSENMNVGLRALEKGGATYVDEPVVVDGSIVTANGPSAAQAFAEAVANLLR